LAGKPTTTREGLKRCSGPEHQGERWLSPHMFQNDRSQPSGKKSQCRDCYNVQQKGRDRKPEKLASSRDRKRANTARADARDEAMLDREEARARAEAAARERRIADDTALLRPDDLLDDEDFDTGVANDPRAKALSSQASRNKRQEFNARMGEHAAALRTAAVSARSSEIADAMPEEAGKYIGALAEQERRFGNRRLARSISLFSAGEELSRRLWMQACRQYLTGRVTPTGYAKKPAGAPAKRSVCLLLSDLHLGADLVAAENPIPFRKVEEARRLEYVLRQAIDYKPQYRSNSELVLMLNGDLIEGLLLHDFRDGAPLTEQKVIFLRYLERFVGECAAKFPRVRVFCQPGNHGRDKVRHPGRATSSKWDGVEWGLYYALSRACSGLRNVEWDLPHRAICKVDLHGQWLLLTHADTEVMLGDPDKKARENAAILDKINATKLYGVEFAAAAFGHYHKGRYVPGRPRQIWNGPLVPPNGHARTSGYIGEVCGQFLWEAVEGFPVGDVRFIEVGTAQDRDEKLGTIIEPFRFDVE
jgi:hypothetical protein